MDSREKFDETIPPNQKDFYSELKLENITDKDYEYARKVFQQSKLKNLGALHDLYVQHYCLQMYLKTLETSVLKHMKLVQLIFCLHLD